MNPFCKGLGKILNDGNRISHELLIICGLVCVALYV